MTDKYLSISEICEMLGVCKMTLHRWCKDGHFPKGIKIGRRVLFPEGKVREFLAKLEAGA